MCGRCQKRKGRGLVRRSVRVQIRMRAVTVENGRSIVQLITWSLNNTFSHSGQAHGQLPRNRGEHLRHLARRMSRGAGACATRLVQGVRVDRHDGLVRWGKNGLKKKRQRSQRVGSDASAWR